MSTRSMIGGATERGELFVYCHFDGYPTGVGNALRAIVDRDGPERALEAILRHGARGGWSLLDPDRGAERGEFDSGDPVAGYGVAYSDGRVIVREEWTGAEK